MRWHDIAKEVFASSGVEFEERRVQKTVIESAEKHFEQIMAEPRRPEPLLISLPCGYGKTIIGELPFLAQLKNGGWAIRGACYTLPTRALTSHHTAKIRGHVITLNPNMKVRAFHGEEHEVSLFFADFAVSTFDTFTLAYARSARTQNHLEFPAGTIATSYIVFDEAHMLQDEYSYSFQVMNRILRTLVSSGVPTFIVTATMPEVLKKIIFNYVDPPPICIPDKMPEEERFRGNIKEVDLKCENILKIIQSPEFFKMVKGKRVLIVCNTVLTAQEVFDKVKKKVRDKAEVLLIHSRLTKEERIKREKLVRSLMSKEACAGKCDKSKELKKPMPLPFFIAEGLEPKVYCDTCGADKGLKHVNSIVIVSTQVVESGLDISSDVLITECAPLDSMIQRVGRCARYNGENGFIQISYHDDVYPPYPKDIVKRTFEELRKREDLPEALTVFSYYKPLIDYVYEKVEKLPLYQELRRFLSYFEGSGFTTFTVDRETLKRIKTRPSAQIIVSVPLGKLPVVIAEDKNEFKRTGKFDRFEPLRQQVVSYDEFIKLINSTNKRILMDCTSISANSFSIDRHLACVDFRIKDFLIHRLNNENCLIKLELVRSRVIKGSGPFFYLAEVLSNKYLDEGTYLLNPNYYNTELGLRRDRNERLVMPDL